MREHQAYQRLIEKGLRPSVQRVAILDYLMNHMTHPSVDEVYNGIRDSIPTLSRTTVYNTLRLLADHHVVSMLTIDEHRVCYDGVAEPHVHFYCKHCGRVIDLYDQPAPAQPIGTMLNGNIVESMQLYYKGICSDCQNKMA